MLILRIMLALALVAAAAPLLDPKAGFLHKAFSCLSSLASIAYLLTWFGW